MSTEDNEAKQYHQFHVRKDRKRAKMTHLLNPDGTAKEYFHFSELLACPICNSHPFTAIGSANQRGMPSLLLTLPRTGSTIIFQILNYLNPGSVVKTHHLMRDGRPGSESVSHDCPLYTTYRSIITTSRNPYDLIYSYLQYYKIDKKDWTQDKFIKSKYGKDLIRSFYNVRSLISGVHAVNIVAPDLLADIPIFSLKYEDYYCNDKQRVIDVIKASNIKNIDRDKINLEEILEKFSIESNIKLKPGHVSSTKGMPGQGIKNLNYDMISFANNHLSWYFEYYNYKKCFLNS